MSELKLPIYQLIEPSRIPGRMVDVGQIQDAAQLLSKAAAAIRTHGPQVEAEWDALAVVYDTPDAPDLFHIMKGTHGVGSLARELADACSRVAGALSALALVIDTHVKDLKTLHEEAVEFRATIHGGMVDAIVYGGSTYNPTETTQSKLWSEDLLASRRNTELIQAVNAAFARLDEAQAHAVNEINAVNPSMLDMLKAQYSPISLDQLNSPGARLPYGEPRTPETCSGENISLTGAQWIADTVNGVTTRFGYDVYDGKFSWATAINARASGLMTEVGLLLFASPVTWILQQSLTNARRSPQRLSAPQMAVSDFINGAGDHAAGAVEGFTQWNTWATDPGKAGTNVVLNVASLFSPVGEVTAPIKALASAKAGALVERIADLGTKVGGPRGEAFAAGVRSTASGVSGALETVHLLRDAPKILLSDLTTALKEHLPMLHSTEVSNGSSGDTSVGSSATPSAAVYDRSNDRPESTMNEGADGHVSPVRRAELLRQQAEQAELAQRSIFESDSWLETVGKPNPIQPRRVPAHLEFVTRGVEAGQHETSNAGSAAGPGAGSTSGYDRSNYNLDGTVKEEGFGELASERRAELLRQQAEHAELVQRSILDSDNPTAMDTMLGKYNDGAPNNYISRAQEGGYAYFDLGLAWNEIQKTFELSNGDMFDLFNVPFLDDAMAARKPVHFSQDPRNDPYSLGDALRYLEQDDKYYFDPVTMTALPN